MIFYVKMYQYIDKLVGGFNPFEKYESNWIISPSSGENKKYLKPPPPGDSLWPFYPLVGGHLTISKGHLTIPKRSQRIARLVNCSVSPFRFYQVEATPNLHQVGPWLPNTFHHVRLNHLNPKICPPKRPNSPKQQV